MSATLSWADVLFRLALGFAAGFLIGLDRGEHAHPAGLRTTILVAVAATVAMIEANWLLVHTVDTKVSIIRLDMMRLPLGILSGIGFIGAGAILRKGELVRGLTTAATLWIVTVLGLLFGAGLLHLGAIASALTLIILWLLKHLEKHVPSVRSATLLVELSPLAPLNQASLRQTLHDAGFRITSWKVQFAASHPHSIECGLRWFRKGHHQPSTPEAIEQLAATPGIARLVWRA